MAGSAASPKRRRICPSRWRDAGAGGLSGAVAIAERRSELFGEASPHATMKRVFEAVMPYIEDQLGQGTRLHSMTRHSSALSRRAGGARVPPPSRQRRQAGAAPTYCAMRLRWSISARRLRSRRDSNASGARSGLMAALLLPATSSTGRLAFTSQATPVFHRLTYRSDRYRLDSAIIPSVTSAHKIKKTSTKENR